MSDINEIPITDSCIYGSVTNQNYLEIKTILGDKILDYKLKKIICQLKSNTCIVGIKFIYRNLDTGEDKALIDITSNLNDLIETDFDLNNEEVKDMKVWLNHDIRLIGFEITTNKNRSKKFGYGNDEQLVKISDFENGDQIIVGFGCYSDDNFGISAIYGQYINKKKYVSIIYSGIFSLRHIIKNYEYKQKIEKKLKNMEENKQILYRICQMPDNQFFNIIKYSIA